MLEFDMTLPNKIYRGNSLELYCHVNIDLENYKISADVFDQFCSSIHLATANNGGSNDEIEVTDEEDGTFIIHIAKNLTTNFHLNSFIEIDLEDADGKVQTVHFARLKFEDNIFYRN